jgi:hypothetical protein
MHHTPQTHASLLARIPEVTGQGLQHWFACLEAGPSLLRSDERARWLSDEHTLPAAYASAIVDEHERRRMAARG